MKNPKLLIIAGIAILGFCYLQSTRQTLVQDEAGIRAQVKAIDISINKMVQKIESKGYVVKDFRETFLQSMHETIGEGGRAAAAGKVFTAVSERYPEVPPQLWLDLSQTMSAEYESMSAAQNTQADRIRIYEEHLDSYVYWLARVLGGFPRIDTEKMGKLIIGEKAAQARETGRIEAVNPFAKPEK